MRKKRISTVRVKDANTSVRLWPADREILIAAATREGISICEFIRRAIRDRHAKINVDSEKSPEVVA